METFGKLTIVRAKDSEHFKDRRIGFVAVTENGSEYFGDRRNQAIQKAVEANGSCVL